MRHGTGWAQFPSDEALDLAHSDPVAFKVKSKSLRLEKNQAKERMKRLSAQRTVQAQNLARRKAERETVENYTQTPYRAATGLHHGVDVMTTRFEEIDGKMKRAVAVRADQVLGKFANFMRENMLRVSDLIAKVDTSCDGVVDIEEMAAAIKMVHLDLSDEEVKILFEFLDDDNSGHIDAAELEASMRDFRRVEYESESLKSYIARTAATAVDGDNDMACMTAEKVIDMRLLSIGVKGKARQINSIPQLGQALIHRRFESDLSTPQHHMSMELAPKLLYSNSFDESLLTASLNTHEPIVVEPSGVKMQADEAILKGNVRDRTLEQGYANTVISRRAGQRSVVSRRKAARELLEAKAGQRAENDLARAQQFYEGVYGEVDITIKEARNIEMADANGTDGVCKIHFSDHPVCETSVQWNTLNPIWNETFRFRLRSEEDLKDSIKVELYDQDPHCQEYLGETNVRLELLEPMRQEEIAVELQKASTGSIFMSVVFLPVDVMIERKAKEFQAEKQALAGKISPRLEEARKAEAKMKRVNSTKKLKKIGSNT
ncbi:hypothetical protein TeGR_g9321 [Tetraparma gracilis]|uniref:Calmodulin n=1 Tax=Tetraparma gracilis TaxID=2962635 RepID=A0ABQ6NBF2_9STRA|nr:hypothetical protein TeGR_g9321 [Tetraparma gracilis]